MSTRTTPLDDRLQAYLATVGYREPPVLAALRERTAALPRPGMQIAPEQGAFLHLLVAVTGARRVLELGVFTGYSSTAMALALPPDGVLVAVDRSEEWTAIARETWEAAGVAERVDLRLGDAPSVLDALRAAGEADGFDLAFVDADKGNLPLYYERCLELVRPGGLVLIDNVLWHGKVADPAVDDSDTRAVRDLNDRIHSDPRVLPCLVPIGDGLTLARKVP